MERLLITGGTGFLGSNILPLLREMYEVTALGRSERNDLRIDLTAGAPILPMHYDIVLHACGKAHTVPKTAAEKQQFFDVNYQGTVNLCKGLEKAGIPKAFVFISSVGVYGCKAGEMISEAHPLEGTGAYAESKIKAEHFLTEWCCRNGVVLTILRPALILGRDAAGSLGAMVNGIRKGRYMNIAGGKARKSVVMAEDIARLVPMVAEKGGIYNVCDTYQPTYKQLSELIAGQLGRPVPGSMPYWFAKVMAKFGDSLGGRFPLNTYRLERMTNSLTFSNEKARRELGWEPADVLTSYKI